MSTLGINNIFWRWLPLLAKATGRSLASLQTHGPVFDPATAPGVRIDFADGSCADFKRAFYVADEAEPLQIAVFTAHCGAHEFHLGPTDIVSCPTGAISRAASDWAQRVGALLVKAALASPAHSRAALAFEAGYLSALQVLSRYGAQQPAAHSERVLQEAAQALEWPVGSMGEAEYFLARQGTGEVGDSLAAGLLAWAHSLYAAAQKRTPAQ